MLSVKFRLLKGRSKVKLAGEQESSDVTHTLFMVEARLYKTCNFISTVYSLPNTAWLPAVAYSIDFRCC